MKTYNKIIIALIFSTLFSISTFARQTRTTHYESLGQRQFVEIDGDSFDRTPYRSRLRIILRSQIFTKQNNKSSTLKTNKILQRLALQAYEICESHNGTVEGISPATTEDPFGMGADRYADGMSYFKYSFSSYLFKNINTPSIQVLAYCYDHDLKSFHRRNRDEIDTYRAHPINSSASKLGTLDEIDIRAELNVHQKAVKKIKISAQLSRMCSMSENQCMKLSKTNLQKKVKDYCRIELNGIFSNYKVIKTSVQNIDLNRRTTLSYAAVEISSTCTLKKLPGRLLPYERPSSNDNGISID